MRLPTTTLLALLSTTSTIIPPVFAAVNESIDTAADTTVGKNINWLDSIFSFFWQEDESFEADGSSTTADDVTLMKASTGWRKVVMILHSPGRRMRVLYQEMALFDYQTQTHYYAKKKISTSSKDFSTLMKNMLAISSNQMANLMIS